MNKATFLKSISSTLFDVLESENKNTQDNSAFWSSLHKTSEELKCKEMCLENLKGCAYFECVIFEFRIMYL